MVEAALKSPVSRFFQRGKLRSRTLTSRWQRGRGDFGRSEGRNYVAHFWVRTLAHKRLAFHTGTFIGHAENATAMGLPIRRADSREGA